MRSALCYAVMLAAMLCGLPVWAHVGSPDVYVRGDAGTHTVFVSAHPSAMVPGAAEIDVRTADVAVTGVAVILPAVAGARWRWVWPWVFGIEGVVLLVGGFVGRRRRNNALRVKAATLELRPTRAPGLSQALAFILMACGVVGLMACVWSVVSMSPR